MKHNQKGTISLLLVAVVIIVVVAGGVLVLRGNSGSDEPDTSADETTTNQESSDETEQVQTSTFTAEVWADNWFAMYANGKLVGEDSVPITTERSFNAETFSFEATYPLTIAIEAKDFKETDSGLEYIGEARQQMGDGGLIAQVTDTQTGNVVAVTDASWKVFVIHKAPLNPECETSSNPDVDCRSEITPAPVGWATPEFDDSSWSPATVWTEADVRPKDGYDEISWDPSAQLIWGSDLQLDNTILVRYEVERVSQ